MKTRLVFGVFFFAAAFSLEAQGAPAPDWRARLREAILRAASRNPELAAMESRIDASRHRVPQAAVLPDPEIEVGIKDIPPSNLSFSRDDFTMETVSARQRFPGAGKRAAARRVAEAELEGASAMHAQHVTEVAADVADAFFELARLDRLQEILGESRRRLEGAAKSAAEHYRAGRGSQSDVLRANLDTTALEERLLSLAAERRGQAARFNAAQGLPAGAPVEPLGPVDPEPEPGLLENVMARAERMSPALAVASAQLRKAQEELELARLERRSDLTAMAYYGRREKFEDLAGASLAITLPFVHRKRLDERRAEMEALVSAARADLEAARTRLSRDILEASAALERETAQARLYRSTILPQAEINLRAATEAYEVGRIDFATFVRAATDLDLYRSELAQRTAGIGRALASLQKASGLPLIPGTPSGEAHGQN
jgi:outer membrane protein TolC